MANGEYRELTGKEIAKYVRSFREMRGIKRLTLAQEAGVSEKSLVSRPTHSETAAIATIAVIAQMAWRALTMTSVELRLAP